LKPQALFTLDLDRCTGCSACAIACRIENLVDEAVDWRRIHTFNELNFPGTAVYHYSLACNHCLEPACMYGCPANAYSKDPTTGAVLLDGDSCIGCHYCTWVCPYGAPQFNPSSGVMEKCTFCSHRLDQGLEPACADACPVDALGFVERGSPDGVSPPGFPDVGLQPAIRLKPRRRGSRAPEMTAKPLPTPNLTEIGARNMPAKLGSEWPLLVFTLLVAGLVAFVTAQLIQVTELHWPAVLAVGIGAMLVSTLHLGKPTRAWRAVLNFRTSWVSREVVFYSLFLGGVLFIGASGNRSTWWSLLVVGLGFAALLSMDRVYNIPGLRVPTVPHSAMTTLTALFVLGLLVGSPWIALPAAALKIVLYLSRPVLHGPGWRALATLRLGLGFLLPALVWLAGIDSMPLLLGGPLLAETIDRAQFYEELDFLTPRRQITSDLASLLATDRA
jgi:Fe-S-cluster-containing dehydrogenase component